MKLPKKETVAHVPGNRGEVRVIVSGTVVLGVVAAVAYLLLYRVTGQPPTSLPMVAGIALLFAVAALRPVALRFGDHALLVTVREVPLVLGLYLASPRQVLATCAAGSLIALIESWHRIRVKALFNLVHASAEAGVFLLVSCAIAPPSISPAGRALLAVLFGVAAKELFATLTLGEVLVRLGRSTSRRKAWRGSVAASISAVAWAAVAVVVVQLARVSPFALVPFIVVITAVLFAQRAALRSDARALQTAQVYTLAKILAEHPYTQTQLAVVAETAREVLQTQRLEVVLLDQARATEGQVHRFAHGEPPTTLELDFAAAGPVGEVLVQGIPKLVSRKLDWTLPDDLHDALIAPLRNEHGVFGTIAAYNRLDPDTRFAQSDLELLTAMASHVAAWLDNAHLIAQLQAEVAVRAHQATHDALTNLLNRDALVTTIDAAIEEAATGRDEGALFLVNIDNFRDINDAFGHERGDGAIRHAAEVLRSTLSAEITSARVSNGTFALLVPQQGDPTELRHLAQRIIDAFRAPVLIDTVLVILQTTIGIAVYPRHALTSGQLLQRADIALVRARRSHEPIAFATQVEEVASRERMELIADLRHAIDTGDITVALQPKVDLAEGVLVGAEALARWTHPTRGPISPQVFIPLVEQSGLIGDLTIHMLRNALSDAAMIRRQIPEFEIAVNLSMRNLLDARLTAQVRDLLAAADFPPAALTLEVTETFVMTDPVRASRQLNELHDLGVQISVDDFGTGHSSLTYLVDLPIQQLKIDRGFVTQLSRDRVSIGAVRDAVPGERSRREKNVAIVASIIDLGRNLGLDVVAEGVESAGAIQQLHDLGCRYAQGYAISPALPVTELLAWHASRPMLPTGNSTVRALRRKRRNHPSVS